MTMAMPGVRRPFVPTEGERKIAHVVRERRLAKRLTQTQLAKRIGVSSQTLLRYEKLERAIPTGHLLGLQEVLGGLGPNDAVLGASPLISESYTAYGAAGPPSPPPGLPLDEDILLRVFRTLSRPNKNTVIRLGMKLAGLQDEPTK